MTVQRIREKIIRLFCAVLCTTVVHIVVMVPTFLLSVGFGRFCEKSTFVFGFGYLYKRVVDFMSTVMWYD